ncbi:hypothetical protein FML32_11435 [Klebsiella oxytoca]|nr:hypothetical protein [Klebsiella oxytoca]MBZ7710493.1 hypothetical protein [Klebsiella oxytoca]
MLMIIFYALRECLANRSECFVIGLTINLQICILVNINQLDNKNSCTIWYFSEAETGCLRRELALIINLLTDWGFTSEVCDA